MKVLIATDGSKYSVEAGREFCQLVSMSDVSAIKIVSATEQRATALDDQIFVASELYSRMTLEATKAARSATDELRDLIVDVLGKDSSVTIETEVIADSPREAIVRVATEWEADLIVVGSHGYGFWDRMLLGSVSDAVVHHAPCSVLVVRH